jgi:hypothetical protein
MVSQGDGRATATKTATAHWCCVAMPADDMNDVELMPYATSLGTITTQEVSVDVRHDLHDRLATARHDRLVTARHHELALHRRGKEWAAQMKSWQMRWAS